MYLNLLCLHFQEVDAGLLTVIGYPAFAVRVPSVIHETRDFIKQKLEVSVFVCICHCVCVCVCVCGVWCVCGVCVWCVVCVCVCVASAVTYLCCTQTFGDEGNS